jgi:hypothetical protein
VIAVVRYVVNNTHNFCWLICVTEKQKRRRCSGS